ncbi:hypothetical protein GUJ93_ZPchr0004g39870 [Zizania palustris]|uniref:Uncharacterized protein n=1 Tax=Zizania palustris TaxID=103762 RepID=A0A8J5VEI0_ZIZPA|nr:hypothetical protein GUJ93_ZPchr0002g24829 [Zizania palustris]KAG8065142.1 hypothetical protein GUJ93_ZPchr0004g39870 [Zizania palustris]
MRRRRTDIFPDDPAAVVLKWHRFSCDEDIWCIENLNPSDNAHHWTLPLSLGSLLFIDSHFKFTTNVVIYVDRFSPASRKAVVNEIKGALQKCDKEVSMYLCNADAEVQEARKDF